MMENDTIDNTIPYFLLSHSINPTISSKILVLSADTIHGGLSLWSFLYYCGLQFTKI